MGSDKKRYAPLGLYLALVAGATAAGLYFVFREFDLNIQIALGVTIIGLAVYVLLDPESISDLIAGRQARYGGNALLLILGVLGILVVINYSIFQNPQRFDITESQTNTLSEDTLEILASLDSRVAITGYFTASAAPSQQQARDLLDDFVFFSDGMLTYEFIDPQQDPVSAQADNISQDRTLVVRMDGDQEAITITNELGLVTALVRLMSGEERAVYFLTGHGEYDPEGFGDDSYSQTKRTLESKNYRVEILNLLAEQEIPSDADVVIIAGALQVPVTQGEIDLLNDYLESGGSVIVLTEPTLITNYGDLVDPMVSYLDTNWGILLSDDMVVDLQTQSGFQAVSNVYQAHEITEKMEGVVTIYPSARSVQLSEEQVSGITARTLVLTAPFDTTWAETDIEGLQAGDTPTEEDDLLGPVPIVAVAENLSLGGKVVVFGDADFAADVNFFGPTGRNGDILINAVDWAAGQENLINLTPRVQTQRFAVLPFESYINLIIFVSVILLPGLVLLAGVIVWFQRRRRL